METHPAKSQSPQSKAHSKILRFEAKIIKAELLTPTVKHFVIEVPDNFSFHAGQFVSLRFTIKNDEGKDELIRRSYSIASHPQNTSTIELCVKLVEGGKASEYLRTREAGDVITLQGPMGHFKVEQNNTTQSKLLPEIIFISTGTGIAPLRGMIKDLFEHNKKNVSKNKSQRVTLLTGYRNENEILYHEEFQTLQNKNKNFTYDVIISRPKGRTEFSQGRVQLLIQKHIPLNFTGQIYLCGLKEMIFDVIKLLNERGVTKEQIHFERYD